MDLIRRIQAAHLRYSEIIEAKRRNDPLTEHELSNLTEFTIALLRLGIEATEQQLRIHSIAAPLG